MGAFLPQFPPIGMSYPITGPWIKEEKEFLRYLTGVPLLYTNFNPRFEQAILTVQSKANGGSLPDESVQSAIRITMYNIAQVDQNLSNGANFGMAQSVDKNDIKVNFIQHRWINVKEGSRLVQMVMGQLGLKSAFKDYFTGKQLLDDWEEMFVWNI